jgi:excinuclease ABC subunit A
MPRTPTTGSARSFSAKFACPVSGFTIEEIEPRLFSFNNPFGACPVLRRPGREDVLRPELVVPDDGQDLREGRGRALGQGRLALLHADAGGAGEALRLLDGHRGRTAEEGRDAILFGTGEEKITIATTTARAYR